MSIDPVRLGIASPGGWGIQLMNVAAASSKLSTVAVFSRSEEKRSSLSAEFECTGHESYEALLSDPRVEAVVLPTPNFLHHPQAMAAIESGKHVFVEKPMANTVEEAEEMYRASLQRNLVLGVGMQLRRTGAARMVKRILSDGELGTPAIVVATHGAPLLNALDRDDWYFTAEQSPGGPLDQLGVHYTDLLQYWFGPVANVSAVSSDQVTKHDVLDVAAVHLTFESGLLGAYVTHQVSAYVSNLTIYGTAAAVHFRRFGQELLWEDIVSSAQAKRDGSSTRPLEITGAHPFSTALQEELEDFANCIRFGGEPEVGGPEGISAIRVVRAALESSRIGSTVALQSNHDHLS